MIRASSWATSTCQSESGPRETRRRDEADYRHVSRRFGHQGGLPPIQPRGRPQNAAFEYDPHWLAAPDRFAIDPALAWEAGIDAASARVVLSDGIPVALIRRFDRREAGRIPYISAATMLRASSGDPADHTYAEMIDALRVFGADPKRDAEELWRRIAFSILITNTDDHLHNHGFLHTAKDTWRLAPAFDVNPFPDRARELKTWISGDSGPQATIDALMSASAYFQLAPAKARGVLRDVENAVAKWRVRGTALGMTSAELDAFHDAFEHEERGKARLAARSRS